MVLKLLNPDKDNRTPFHKRLRWMIQNPPEGSVRMTVTPEMAHEMLAYNEGNRPPSDMTVRAYARQMSEGKWLYARSNPIVFSDDGRLNNGQHRLLACIKSGCAFETDVAFGDPRDSFVVTDIGRKRTAGDVFAINGVPNYSQIAAATKWLWRYENYGMFNPTGPAAPTNDELYEFYLARQDLQKSLTAGKRFCDAKLAPASLMAALHYICASKSRSEADAFFEKVATGIGFESRKDPAYKLREKLIENTKGEKSFDDMTLAAYTVLAWNAIRSRRPVEIFRWRTAQRPDAPFPRVI